MANECTTDIIIQCDDLDKLRELEQKIYDWTPDEAKAPGAKTWLGDIAKGAGISEEVEHYGYMVSAVLDNDRLQILTEVAREPLVQLWVEIAKKYLPPQAQVFYSAVECGAGIYVTNNPYYEGMWYVDVWEPSKVNNGKSCWVCEEDEVIDMLNSYLNQDLDDVDELLELFRRSGGVENAVFLRWTYVPAEMQH